MITSGARTRSGRAGARLRTGLAAALTAVCAATALPTAAHATPEDPPAGHAAAEGTVRHVGGATAVPDSYLVVLRDGAVGGRAGQVRDAVAAKARALAGTYRVTLRDIWGDALNGFSATMSARTARRLAADPAVAYVEQDHLVSAEDLTAGAVDAPATGDGPATTGTQTNPPWGLDRVDQRNLPLDLRYAYPDVTNTVRVYVLDTGIRISHTQFGGRAYHGYDAVDGSLPADDCNGHGTHVAGLIGGATYGVAKTARLVSVRVLDCNGSGSWTQVVNGINWVTADHDPGEAAVANMSIGGAANSTVDSAVANSIADGVTYGVAAGGSNTDACATSPARVGAALTVAGTTNTDARMSSASYGTCLDLFAPGMSATSAWHTGDTATATLSGTSMAAAYASGAAALVAAANPTWTAAQVCGYLTANATAGVVSNPGAGSPNRLLYVVH